MSPQPGLALSMEHRIIKKGSESSKGAERIQLRAKTTGVELKYMCEINHCGLQPFSIQNLIFLNVSETSADTLVKRKSIPWARKGLPLRFSSFFGSDPPFSRGVSLQRYPLSLMISISPRLSLHGSKPAARRESLSEH